MSLKAKQCGREISSWIQAGIDAFIPCRKFQARPNSSPWFSPACAAAIAHRNHYFHTYKSQPNAENRDLLRKASNSCKRVLNNAKSSYADRTHIRISSQKLGSRDFWRIYNLIVNKNKSLIPPLINGPEVLTSAKDKAELFAQLFAINSNIDDSNATLPDFPKRTKSTLSNINFTVSDVSKIITGLDSSKASGPDSIPVIVLQMCTPELAPVLTKLFKKCIKESCFPSCWKLPSVVPVFKNHGECSNQVIIVQSVSFQS